MSDFLLDPAHVPLTLYIHVPWCIKKCPYCDFNSHPLTDTNQFDAYVDALLADADAQIPLAQNRPIHAIFIGGGTPSLLPIPAFKRLFVGLRQFYTFVDDIEITLEVNPATIEHAPFIDYLDLGINRLSIGVQSFDDMFLSQLGRIHNGNQAYFAIEQARRAGFQRLNVDLMHGLPKQTPKNAVHDIQQALQAGATHVSWYQLTIEPNTVFYHRPPTLPDENDLASIEALGKARLLQSDFYNYEVSAWVSKQDTPCRHNMNYWQFGDYLAIGAGGHGKVTVDVATLNQTLARMDEIKVTGKQISDCVDNSSAVFRFSKSRLPKDYMAYQMAPKMVSLESVTADQLIGEFMMDALRLSQGFTAELFVKRTGLTWMSIEPIIKKLQQQGLLHMTTATQTNSMQTNTRIHTTELGKRYLNQVIAQFL